MKEFGSIVLLVALVHYDVVNNHVFWVGDDARGLALHEGDNFVNIALSDLLSSLFVIEVLVVSHFYLTNSINQKIHS